MIIRTIKCSVCGCMEMEKKAGEGWVGWGALHGIELNGQPNPSLCPRHLTLAADFVDRMTTSELKLIGV